MKLALPRLDVDSTFGAHAMGKFDPTAVRAKGYFKKGFAVGGGACVVVVTATGKGGAELTVSGAEAERVFAFFEAAAARDDGADSFEPAHPLVAKLHRHNRGLRLLRVPWAFDVAMQTVLGQRVTTEDAMRGFRRLAQRHGAAVDADVRAGPGALQLAAMPSWQLEQLAIDPKRARAMLSLARAIKARPGFWDSPILQKLLDSVPGIGPWTIGNVMGQAMGDPDALVIGDLHLPHVVTWALAQEPRGTDDRMLELLEPFKGQRYRVTRLLMSSGLKLPRVR